MSTWPGSIGDEFGLLSTRVTTNNLGGCYPLQTIRWAARELTKADTSQMMP